MLVSFLPIGDQVTIQRLELIEAERSEPVVLGVTLELGLLLDFIQHFHDVGVNVEELVRVESLVVEAVVGVGPDLGRWVFFKQDLVDAQSVHIRFPLGIVSLAGQRTRVQKAREDLEAEFTIENGLGEVVIPSHFDVVGGDEGLL